MINVKPFLFSLLLLCFSPSLGRAQDTAEFSAKVSTLNGTIQTLYQVISGAKGEPRNWELFRFLFYENAKLIPTGKDKTGIHRARYMTPEDYIKSSGVWLEENGFYENELHRVEQTYGNITHVFSTYESFRSSTDAEPFMRGINSIQLMNDGNRWWIMNIYWESETAANPIPPQFLPKN